MKKNFLKKITVAIMTCLVVFSCNTNKTQRGAGMGAVAGGVRGAVIGNNIGNKKNAALGAAIGAAIGGATGGVIGNKMDKQAREIQESIPGAKVERVGEGIKVTLSENSINFDFNKSNLTNKSRQNLDKIVKIFKDNPDTNISIFGYTDSVGSDQVNLRVSKERAKTVANYLIASGILTSRILTTEGFGKQDPIADNSSEAGRAQNRRVEFSITANKKMVDDAQKEVK